MCSFDWSVLVGGVGASGAYVVSALLEELSQLWVAIEFATLVHVGVFVRAVRGMDVEEVSYPVDWCGFGEACFANEFAGGMVADKNPAGFAVESFIISSPVWLV